MTEKPPVLERLNRYSPEDVVRLLRLQGFKKSGNCMRGPCPLHGGKDPNFAVYLTDHGTMWTCHSRCQSGDAFDLFARMNGMSAKADFAEAVELLEREIGVVVTSGEDSYFCAESGEFKYRPGGEEKESRHDLQRSLVLGNFMQHVELRGEALGYLKLERRCWNPSLQFRPAQELGFGLYDSLALKKVQEAMGEDLVREHLGVGRGDSLDLCDADFRRHPLLMPVTNPAGQVVAIQGRSIDPKCPKKYRYTSRGSASLGLFGGADLPNHPDALVVLCEGALDALTLRVHTEELAETWGPFVAVGRAGASGGLSKPQAEALSGRRVLLAYDGDEAGAKGAESAASALYESSVKLVQVLRLPRGADLNSLVRLEAA